ncbi:hypothetical protein ACFWJM_30305, partial [Streptomyces sp. NPDC127077]
RGPGAAPLLGWARSAGPPPAPAPWPGAGALTGSGRLSLTVESDRLIVFGDGMEGDAVELVWGQTVQVGVAGVRLRLVG